MLIIILWIALGSPCVKSQAQIDRAASRARRKYLLVKNPAVLSVRSLHFTRMPLWHKLSACPSNHNYTSNWNIGGIEATPCKDLPITVLVKLLPDGTITDVWAITVVPICRVISKPKIASGESY